MYDTTLYESEFTNLKANTNDCILRIYTVSSDYDNLDFETLTDYLITFWYYVKQNNFKYHMLIDINNATISKLPIMFYKTLVQKLNSLGGIFENHLHSSCIICNKSSLTYAIFNVLFTLYSPKRPLSVVNSENDVNDFFTINKLDK